MEFNQILPPFAEYLYISSHSLNLNPNGPLCKTFYVLTKRSMKAHRDR
jgi:hypothetical protein